MTFRIRKYKELYVAEKKTQLPTCHIGIRGEFRIVKQNEMGQVNYDSGWFPNLITDRGLQKICYSGWRNYMQVGSGTTPASFSDTALESYIGRHSNGSSSIDGFLWTADNSGPPNYIMEQVAPYLFPAGSGTGTISEIGLSTEQVGDLAVRALVPVPVVKSSIEVMTIYHKVFVYPDLSDKTGQIVMQGSAGASEVYDYVLRGFNLDYDPTSGGYVAFNTNKGLGGITEPTTNHGVYDGEIGSYLGGPAGNYDGCVNPASNYENVDLVARTSDNSAYYGLTEGNFGTGIRCARVIAYIGGSNSWGWQVRFGRNSDDAAIMKDNTQDLRIRYTMTWNRV